MAASNRSKIFKIFISTKTMYFGQKTRGWENPKGEGKRYGLIETSGYFKYAIYWNIS